MRSSSPDIQTIRPAQLVLSRTLAVGWQVFRVDTLGSLRCWEYDMGYAQRRAEVVLGTFAGTGSSF